MKELQRRDEITIIHRLDQAPEKPSSRPDLVEEIEVQVPLTVAVPLMAITGVVAAVGLFALLLMRLPQDYAPMAAGVFAVIIVAATVVVAARKEFSKRTIAELSALVLYPVALAAVLVYVVGFAAGTGDEARSEGASVEAASETVVAQDLEFSNSELRLPAGEDSVLTLENNDSAPHNFSIYKDDSLDPSFFTGQNIEPGDSFDYAIPALEAGAYYFRCDLHPDMDGRLIVD
ncbi:MAG: cupredoxin domain-containing protein [Actinomycetota bacterium]|nr:cupredoxin domain-containing protein [Actinomycetota bacterium]